MKLNQAIALFISVLVSAAHSQDTVTYEPFKVVVGAQRGSDIFPCADYASNTNYAGQKYMTSTPESKEHGAPARWILRHEGMDFCGGAGTEVIAPVNGEQLQSLQPRWTQQFELRLLIQQHFEQQQRQ